MRGRQERRKLVTRGGHSLSSTQMPPKKSKPKEPTERVFLIDSFSHIFRAFFAPMGGRQEPLRNSRGQVTQAVFVFTNMLRKLLNDENPDYIAAVFDTALPTFRHDSFAGYKANRADMPDDLSSQMPYIIKVCEAFSIPILKMDGFEADDIIGTLAKKVADKGMQAVIVSNDKDLCQLVSDPLIVCMRQNSQNIKRKVAVPPIEWCDEAWVENKFGVPASKIIDLLGLMGDAIDNIPGAPGIGEKGATKIIQQFGSAEDAMRRADEVTHKTYREALQNHQDIIRQSIELATVHCAVPVELDLDALRHREPNRQLAYKLFRELEFTSLTREFADSTPLFDGLGNEPLVRHARRYQIINNRADLDKLIRRLWETEHWSFQVDDSSSPPKADSYAKKPPPGVAIATGAGASYYVDLEKFAEGTQSAIEPLRDILSNGFLPKVTHDYKCNLAVLKKIGIEPEAVEDDTMIAAYLIDSSRTSYNVSNLAFQFLGEDITQETPEGWTDNQYATTERADFVFQLAPILRKKIEEDDLGKIYDEIELPLIPLLYRIEVAGMKVNEEALKGFSDYVSTELETLREKIYAISGHEFNIASPKQVGEVLAELNIAGTKKTATGQISTSKDILLELAETYEIARLIIDYRELDKLKATYADALPKMIDGDGRIHGNLNQTVAVTGRLSSTEPNLQNIPIRTELGQQIRKAFIPEKGCKLISADYSQLELRLLAHITRDEAKKVIEDYYETYKGVRRFMAELPEQAKEKGYVTSMLGRRRYLPTINDRNYSVRSRAEREAINMPIQGTASDIVKIAMLKVDEALRRANLETKIIMQVHDELLLEAPEVEVERAMEIVKREMEIAVELDVPLMVEIGAGNN